MNLVDLSNTCVTGLDRFTGLLEIWDNDLGFYYCMTCRSWNDRDHFEDQHPDTDEWSCECSCGPGTFYFDEDNYSHRRALCIHCNAGTHHENLEELLAQIPN